MIASLSLSLDAADRFRTKEIPPEEQWRSCQKFAGAEDASSGDFQSSSGFRSSRSDNSKRNLQKLVSIPSSSSIAFENYSPRLR